MSASHLVFFVTLAVFSAPASALAMGLCRRSRGLPSFSMLRAPGAAHQKTGMWWSGFALPVLCLAGWAGTAAGQNAAQAARLLGQPTYIAQGAFFHSIGLAMDGAGNLYVSEAINNDIIKIPFSGGSYGTPVQVATGLSGISEVAVDNGGNLYFGTSSNPATVQKISYSAGTYGPPVVVASGFRNINSIRLDSALNIYVSDSRANVVQKIPFSAGSYGTPVTLGSGFNVPTGIAIDRVGNVYVDDSGNGVLKVIPYSGGIYGAPIALVSRLRSPTDIAVDGSGNIYVADSGFIEKLIYNGGFSNGYQGPYILGGGSGDADFGPTLDSAGNVYALNVRSGQYGQTDAIVKIGPVPAVIDFGSSNVGVLAPSTQTLFFALDYGGTIQPPQATSIGGVSADFTDTGAGTCTSNGSSYSYNSSGDTCTVTVSFTPASPGVRNADVLISNTNSYTQIGVAALQGTGIGAQVTFPPGAAPTATSGYGAAYGLAVVQNSFDLDVYTTDYSGNLGSIRFTTTFTGSGGAGPGMGAYNCNSCHPVGLAIDHAYRAIFTDISDNTVKLITLQDTTYSQPLTVATGFYQPMGVAVDALGNIYVADTNHSSIQKISYTPYDGMTAFNQFTYGTPVVLGSGFSYPQGVAVDGAGNVYVADTYNNAVKKIPYSAGTYGAPVLLASGLNYPSSVGVDGGGNVYVVDQGSNTVKKIPYIGGSYGAPVTLNSTGFNNPAALFVNSAASVYVTEPATGTLKFIDLSDAPSLNFPDTMVGSTSASQTVTFANTGNFPLTLVPPATGYNPSVPANFTLANASSCPQVSSMSSMTMMLAPGASCAEILSFAPTTAGGVASQLTVSDKLSIPSATVTQTVALSGQATPLVPVITVPDVTAVSGATITLSESIAYSGTAVPNGAAASFQVDARSPTDATCSGTSSPLTCTATIPGTLSAGTHTLTGRFAGDANYDSAKSAPAKLTVVAPTVTITVPPVSVLYNSPFTETASIAYTGPNAPTGAVTFLVATGNSPAMLTATCTGTSSPLSCSYNYSNTPAVGSYTVTVRVAGDANYATTSNTGTLVVTSPPPTISVATVSTTYGSPSVPLSASIAYTGSTVPTGVVNFKVDGGAPIAASCSGSASPLSCSGTYASNALTTGNHTITASIAADGNYPAASNTSTLTITAASPAVTVTAASSTYGTATTTLSASVIYLGPSAPTGALTIRVDGGASLAATCTGTTQPLTCSAAYASGALSGGSHTITASIAADANYTASSGMGTLTVTQATPSITVPAVAVTYGAATTTLSASITYPAQSAPTGAVSFKVDSGASVVATCTGAATPLLCSASYPTGGLATGSHTVTAMIAADANYATASNAAALTVGRQATVSTLAVSSLSATPTQTTTLTATVSAAVAGSPTGTVTFYANGVPLGSPVPVTAGQAQLTTTLPSGAQAISAMYSGDANFQGSSAAAGTTVTVAALDFTLSSTSVVSLSVVPGSSATFSFNVSPLYQVYPGPVSFSISGLPPGATYTITPTSIPANGGAQNVTVTIKTVTASARNTGPARGAPIALALFVPLLAFGVLRRRHRWLSVLVLVAGVFAGSSLVGCGDSGNGTFGQAPQTYPLVLTVTSGSSQHTINVSLQVL